MKELFVWLACSEPSIAAWHVVMLSATDVGYLRQMMRKKAGWLEQELGTAWNVDHLHLQDQFVNGTEATYLLFFFQIMSNFASSGFFDK